VLIRGIRDRCPCVKTQDAFSHNVVRHTNGSIFIVKQLYLCKSMDANGMADPSGRLVSSLAAIAGTNPTGGMAAFILRVLCVVK
jgi:hypothetical protein